MRVRRAPAFILMAVVNMFPGKKPSSWSRDSGSGSSMNG